MGKISTKENKKPYQLRREELGLSREKASELMNAIPPERIEKIENRPNPPYPEEVLAMAEAYKMPELCNYYCSNECPIGQECVPEIQIKDLSRIVLEMIASLNALNHKQERLIEITADGQIDEMEISDFIKIQDELDKMSISLDTLRLWSQNMLANGAINVEKYKELKGIE